MGSTETDADLIRQQVNMLMVSVIITALCSTVRCCRAEVLEQGKTHKKLANQVKHSFKQGLNDQIMVLLNKT